MYQSPSFFLRRIVPCSVNWPGERATNKSLTSFSTMDCCSAAVVGVFVDARLLFSSLQLNFKKAQTD